MTGVAFPVMRTLALRTPALCLAEDFSADMTIHFQHSRGLGIKRCHLDSSPRVPFVRTIPLDAQRAKLPHSRNPEHFCFPTAKGIMD